MKENPIEGKFIHPDFTRKLERERDEAQKLSKELIDVFLKSSQDLQEKIKIEEAEANRAWKAVERIQDERAASFAMLSKTVGGVGMTEYQPEVDLEIDARIQQIKFEKEELRECLIRLKSVYCDFYASKSNLWKKVKDVLEKTK